MYCLENLPSLSVIASARAIRARGNPGQVVSMNWTPTFAGVTTHTAGPGCTASGSGNSTVNVLPLPRSLTTWMRPWNT